MFRSLMAIIRELYLYLTKVIFTLKHSVKLRRYIYQVMWQRVVERYMPLYDMLPHHLNYILTYILTYSLTYLLHGAESFLRS